MPRRASDWRISNSHNGREPVSHREGFSSTFLFSAPGAADVTPASHVRILIGFRRLGRRLFIRRRFSGTPARRFGRRRFVIGICDRSRGAADLYPAFGALARIADPVSLCLPIFVGRNNGLHILTRQLPRTAKGPPALTAISGYALVSLICA